ncbi:MAG: hypothetical protein AMXMBFR44_0620 [Candidatus Campbellbacteria bacterium]
MRISIPQQKNGGQAFILSILFLILISLGSISAMLFPLLRDFASARESLLGMRAYFLAESLVEDLVFRAKLGMDVDPTEQLVIDGYIAESVETTNPSGRTYTATANYDGRIRKIQSSLNIGEGTTFNYGVQTGNGGFFLANNAGVAGNVYSNGDIIGSNGAFISGTAIAANSAALFSDQENGTPLPPASELSFGVTSATQDMAQSFQVSTTSPVNKVRVYLKKTGSPGNLNVRITTDNGGKPAANSLTTQTLPASQVSGVYGWVDVVFSNNPELTSGTTYWLVLDGSTSATKYYTIGSNTAYGSGTGKTGAYGGTWNDTTPADQDIYFSIYLGGLTATLNNVIVGENGIGSAHAHTVTNTTVAGELYCQNGSGNNKPCDTSLPDPSPVGFPVSESNIAQWKADAEAGGTWNGDYNITATTTLGPIKITGDLIMDNQAEMTMEGTIWVEGDIYFRNGTIVRLDPAYGRNSGIIIADGPIEFDNSGEFEGTGQTGSYILVLTTSDCPTSASCGSDSAIETNNGTGGALLNAQKGTIAIGNNVDIKEITAYKISVGQGTTVTYELGLANVNFVSGPSGAFGITGWREVQ